MNDLLWPRVFTAFLEDASLSVLCGLLLSSYWLKGQTEREDHASRAGMSGLAVFTILLFLTACGQLFLLASSFSGQTSLRLVLTSMPDVCSTHAGYLSLALCASAAALCAAAYIPAERLRSFLCALLVTVCFGLHACTGHAAADGVFSVAELLQGIHLVGMGLWSGGVIVSGLFIVPRLYRQAAFEAALHAGETEPSSVVREYLGRLSVVSTWAVGAVIATGVAKSYRATDGRLPPILSSHWGHILLAKIAIVILTVILGARNRWLLATVASGEPSFRGRVTRTLRAESLCMLGVLLLSAWLSNSPPPLE